MTVNLTDKEAINLADMIEENFDSGELEEIEFTWLKVILNKLKA